MPAVADRVKETTTTTGTGTLTLGGAVSNYQAFGTAFGAASTPVYYEVDDGAGNWEVGLGTYTLSGTTLSRSTVLASSNSGSLVSFSAGTKNVACVFPAQAIQSRGRLALTDASTVTMDCSKSDAFFLLATSGIGATRALGAPTNMVDGQSISLIYQQDASGSRALTLNSVFKQAQGAAFGGASTGANQYDLLTATYSATLSAWLYSYGPNYA